MKITEEMFQAGITAYRSFGRDATLQETLAGIYEAMSNAATDGLGASQGTWPALQWRDKQWYHWLHSGQSSDATIAEWINGKWYNVNENGGLTPPEMRRCGWEYLGPVGARPKSKYLDE